MSSLIDKLSSQLEYHRISAKYTKRKPLKSFQKGSSSPPGYTNNSTYLENDENFQGGYKDEITYKSERSGTSSSFSNAENNNSYRDTIQELDQHKSRNGPTGFENKTNENQLNIFDDNFSDAKTLSSGPFPTSPNVQSNPTLDSNTSSMSSFGFAPAASNNPFGVVHNFANNSSAIPNEEVENKNTPDVFGQSLSTFRPNNNDFDSFQDFHHTNEAAPHNEFLSPYEEVDHLNRYSIDEHDRQYSNGTGLVTGHIQQREPFIKEISKNSFKDKYFSPFNSKNDKNWSNQFENNYNDNNGIDDYGIPKSRNRRASMSFFGAPIGEAAKAAINGFSNFTTGNAKRTYNIPKSNISYEGDIDDNYEDSRVDSRGYKDYPDIEKQSHQAALKEKKYSDYSDEENIDEDIQPRHKLENRSSTLPVNSHRFCDTYTDNSTQIPNKKNIVKSSSSAGIWSKLRSTSSKTLYRRNTLSFHSSDGQVTGHGSTETEFRRPRFLSSASGTKASIPSYDYSSENAYHDEENEWAHEKYSRSRDNEHFKPKGQFGYGSSVPSSRSMKSIKAGLTSMGFRGSSKGYSEPNAIEERYENYGYDDSEVAGIPAKDLSYRYKQGFGNSR